MKKALMIILLLSIPTMAHANEIPKYDVDKFCNQMAKAAGGSATIRNTCMDLEQTTYNKLKKDWKNIPANTKEYCDKIATSVGGSYQAFDECMNMEKKEQKKKKKFKY